MTDQPETQEHGPEGPAWERHVEPGTPRRSRAADREIRRAIEAEQYGEYDPATGLFRPSTWTDAT